MGHPAGRIHASEQGVQVRIAENTGEHKRISENTGDYAENTGEYEQRGAKSPGASGGRLAVIPHRESTRISQSATDAAHSRMNMDGLIHREKQDKAASGKSRPSLVAARSRV